MSCLLSWLTNLTGGSGPHQAPRYLRNHMAYYEFKYGYRTRTEARAILEADNLEQAEDMLHESFNTPDDLLLFDTIDQDVELMDGGMVITEHIDKPKELKRDSQIYNEENINTLTDEVLSRLDDSSLLELAGEAVVNNYREYSDLFFEEWEEFEMDKRPKLKDNDRRIHNKH